MWMNRQRFRELEREVELKQKMFEQYKEYLNDKKWREEQIKKYAHIQQLN